MTPHLTSFHTMMFSHVWKLKQPDSVHTVMLRRGLLGRSIWWDVLNWFSMWTPRHRGSSWKRRYCQIYFDQCLNKVLGEIVELSWSFVGQLSEIGIFCLSFLWLSDRSRGNAPSCGGWRGPACCVTKAPLHRRASQPSRVHWTPLWCWTSLGSQLLVTTG